MQVFYRFSYIFDCGRNEWMILLLAGLFFKVGYLYASNTP